MSDEEGISSSPRKRRKSGQERMAEYRRKNSFASPGTFSEKLDLDQKLQIILILQRQQS